MTIAIAATAERILAAVEAWYADEDHGAQPLPARRYVAAGDPRSVAWDDSAGQVTVAFSAAPLQTDPTQAPAVTQGPARSGQRGVQLIRVGVYEVQIVRPAPMPGYEGQPPSGQTLNDHGLLVMRDAEQIVACVNDAQQSGAFIPEGHGPARLQVPIIETLGPSGGLAAIAVGIQVVLI